ncbi:MAG TPA: methyltransferase domain-containing protein [Bryobacteraceae bacterium]
MTEFTGERVIPGQVNDDLWAEHMARYAFAARFAAGCRALDAGCGTGYGVNELASSAGWVVGADVAPEAIEYAREYARAHFTHARTSFLLASAAALPFSTGAFGLVTAFEVIEHLASWRELLREGRRVLAPGGLFLVSTPNRLYYADSRRLDGPNPYHVHEFEFDEFDAALREFFPHVAILFQNHVEAFAFHGAVHGRITNQDIEVRLDTATDEPANAHFFIGVCSDEPLPELQTFFYVPRAANVLREREQHIRLLDAELAQSKQWLDQNISDHHRLQEAHEEQTRHLEAQNRWTAEVEQNLKEAQARIAQLQEEFRTEQRAAATVAAGYARKVADLEQENREKTAWALDTEARLSADLAARAELLSQTLRLLDTAEATVIERTQWAQHLDAELTQLRTQMAMIRESRWVKLGRTVGIGPRVE